MTIRTHVRSLPASLKSVTSKLARKQNHIAVWTIIAALLIQTSAIARVSAAPVRSANKTEAGTTEAGTVFNAPTGTRVVRVTDSRDGHAVLTSRVNRSSFNLDSSQFILDLDGVPTLYGFNPSSLEVQKQGRLFGSIQLQADSCQWSATEAQTIIGLGTGPVDSTHIYAYDTRSGSYSLLKDLSNLMPGAEAQHLSKSWSNDNQFAFSLREPGSSWRFVAVWDKTTNNVSMFDIADSVSGVTGFVDARLDRSGEALIVNGDVTRVWRYREQQQSDSVQLEQTGDANDVKTAQSEVADLFAVAGGPADLPRNDVSRDGRFSIFPSRTDASRSDVFIAAVNINATASSVNWTHMVNCSTSANSLMKTGGADTYDDAHATSAQAVLSGDASVEFTADQTDKEAWCGFNNSNAIHQTASDINFAIRLGNNRKVHVIENGIIKTKIKYKPGNVFKVAVESGVVNYYKNGEVFYTSTATPSYPMLVNASLVDSMATLSKVMISLVNIGTVVSISPARATATPGAPATQFTALITGSSDTISWSASAGVVNSAGVYSAPPAAGTYSVKAACASNPNISASATVSVSLAADSAAPVITGVTASAVTATGATIAWNTDEPSDTQVEYGTSAGYGGMSTQNPALVTSHSVAFGGLSPATLYHFRVRSSDGARNVGLSGDFTFTTLAGADTTPPLISGVQSSAVTVNSATITWITNEASDTQVEYGATSGYGNSTPLNSSLATNHSVVLSGLTSGAMYHYRVKSKDAAGNIAMSGDVTFATQSAGDTTPPVLSGISTASITTNSALTNWSSNEASNSQVEYGTTSGYGSSTALNSSMVTSHSVFLSGLSASTLYHFRVKSRDAAGNLSMSSDSTFTTSAVPPPPPPTSSTVITDHNVYAEAPAPVLPRAGGTYVDPVFGTTIMRVTDENDGTSCMNYYSYWPTFNLDSTRFFIACDNNPRLYRFDPNNFQIISKGPLFTSGLPGGGSLGTEDAIWSGTNANVIYGYAGLKLWAYDVSAGSYSLIKDFAGEVTPGNLGQMSKSTDDNVFAFTKKDTNFTTTGYIVWRRDQNRILRDVSIANYDEAEIDKTGRYLVVKAEMGGGVDFQAIDLQTGVVQNLTDPTPDFSPGHSDNGRQIVVGFDNWNNRYTTRSLATPHQFQTVIAFGSDWSQGNHLSMLADNESWCVISNFNAGGSGPVGPFHNEIFQAATDGSQNVRRLAQHRSVYRDYWDTPRADASRDGRFVAYTSNWGSTSRRDVFIVKVPQGTGGSAGPADSTAPVISGVSASTSGSVNWTTNELSDTQVEFGTTTAYGSGTTLSTAMTTSHSATLAGLAASTQYHYRVRSKDAAGNQAVSGDFSFTTSAGGGGSASTQSVVWTGVVNCSVSGNSVQKNSGRDDESDAGAMSQQQIMSGDAYVEFTAGPDGRIRFCGLTHSVSGTDFTAIDFAIKLTEFGVAEIRENNAYLRETTYVSSDVFRIAIEGGAVKYSKNGTVFYTSGKAPAYPLRVDATFIQMNGTVNNAVVSAGAGGSLALFSIEESADMTRQIVASNNLFVEAGRDWMTGAAIPASLRKAFALSRT